MNRSLRSDQTRAARWPAVLFLTIGVVAMVVLNGDSVKSTNLEAVIFRPVVPTTSDASVGNSTWYCAGGTISDGGLADQELLIANPENSVVKVQLSIFPVLVPAPVEIDLETSEEISAQLLATPPQAVDLGIVSIELSIEPMSVLRTRVGDLEGVQGDNAAVLVESDIGSLVVEHLLSGEFGAGISPCASSSSSSWHFAAGTTRNGAREILSLFNPFPGDAVVDMSFVADTGLRSPQIYDGLVVPSGSVLPVDITGVVTLSDSVSANIEVHKGRLVVDRLLILDGVDGLGGTSISLGSPHPTGVWFFPSSAPSGATDAIVIHNPSTESEAELSIEIILDFPDFNGMVVPVEVTISPGRTETVVLSGAAELVSSSGVIDVSERIIPGVGYWAAVRSLNGIDVVADHFTIASDPLQVATSGSPGVSVAATGHVVVIADPIGEVVFVNPASDRIALVEMYVFVEGQAFILAPAEVSPSGRLVLDLAALGIPPNSLLSIDATEPLLGERRVSSGGGGSTTARLIPVWNTTSVPVLPLS